jgi:hypothetical protein
MLLCTAGDLALVGLIGHLLANRGQVVLAVGLLDMGEYLGSCAHEMYPAPEEIPGGAHRRGIDVGLREHAPAQEDRDVLGIDSVVVGCAAMDRFPVQGVAENKRNPFARTEVGQPIPGAESIRRRRPDLPGRAPWP